MITSHYTFLVSSINPKTFAKYYIGVRTCNCLPDNDPYLGSSVHLKFDLESFGQLSFEKIIINKYDNRKEANVAESKLLADHNARYSALFYNKGKDSLIRKQFKVPKEVVKTAIINEPRPKCKCGKNRAVNYKKDNKTYYRKTCHACNKLTKKPTKNDRELAGYNKKMCCEKCQFKARYNEQIKVIQTRGALRNYKSVCLNCEMALSLSGGWCAGDLTPDF